MTPSLLPMILRKSLSFPAVLGIALTLGLLLPLNGQVSTPPLSNPTTAPAAIDPAKVAEIHKLLELSGTAKLMAQMKTQLVSIFERQHPEIPPSTWQRLEDQMDEKQLLEQIIPVYDKYFSLADLKALNAFYETPPGQRMLAVMPQVMHDSMQLGQEWGRNAAAKLAEQIRQERGAAGVAPGAAPAKGN